MHFELINGTPTLVAVILASLYRLLLGPGPLASRNLPHIHNPVPGMFRLC